MSTGFGRKELMRILVSHYYWFSTANSDWCLRADSQICFGWLFDRRCHWWSARSTLILTLGYSFCLLILSWLSFDACFEHSCHLSTKWSLTLASLWYSIQLVSRNVAACLNLPICPCDSSYLCLISDQPGHCLLSNLLTYCPLRDTSGWESLACQGSL